MKKNICLLFVIFVISACKKDEGAVNVTIQNVSHEAIAVKLTDTGWAAIDVGATYTFENYNAPALQFTQVFVFTKDESAQAFAAVNNCTYVGTCTDIVVKPPYGGGVIDKFFDFRRDRKVKLDGEETIPKIVILAERKDSLTTGANDRDAQKIHLRMLN